MIKENYYYLIHIIICSILFFISPKPLETCITHNITIIDFLLPFSVIVWIVFLCLFISSIEIIEVNECSKTRKQK